VIGATIRLRVDGVLVDEQPVQLGAGARGLIGVLGADHGARCAAADAAGQPWSIEIEFADGEHVRWGTDGRGMVDPVPVRDLAAAIERQWTERHTTMRIPAPCPHCGRVTDAATGATLDSTVPADGDVSVCFYCGAIAVFSATGLRHPTDAERAAFLADPDVVAAVGAVLAYRAEAPE
jgi:hypothetical protein